MKSNNKRVNTIISLLLFSIIIIGLIVFVFFLFRADRSSFNEFEEIEQRESAICSVDNFEYPFFEYSSGITKKSIKVNMIFANERLSNINLIHEVYYLDTEMASVGNTRNHVHMNRSFGDMYGTDAFNANYDVDGVKMRMSLYSEANKLSEDAKKYFLANDTILTKNELIKNYEFQGFSCIINN